MRFVGHVLLLQREVLLISRSSTDFWTGHGLGRLLSECSGGVAGRGEKEEGQAGIDPLERLGGRAKPQEDSAGG